MKTLAQLAAATLVKAAGGNLDTPVQGIYCDSRQVKPGGLFVAIPGLRTDGHLFIEDALRRGAVAVVVERARPLPEGVAWLEVPSCRRALGDLAAAYFDYPANSLRLYGVTGTNGKTTTTYLIAAVLEKAEVSCGLIGTTGVRLGKKWMASAHTTPEANDLQELLHRMREEGLQAAVMEVSSHALELERVRGCTFDVGVFTNLTQDHLDFHPDMDSYLRAKAKLFQLLDPQRKGRQYAVLNADDPASEEIAKVARAPVVTYGLKKEAQVRAENIVFGPKGARMEVVWPEGRAELNLVLTGLFNVYNALAAWAVGWQEGLAPDLVAQALFGVKGVPGRFERVEAGQGFGVVVDYAHTPDGLAHVLHAARQLTSGRVIVVFGCGGDRDRGKRPKMGAIAAEGSDLAVITSDNPRSEDPDRIIQDILAGFLAVRRDGYLVEPDRYRAIELALLQARDGDLVLIAGKGHETYQIIKDQVLPFDDREVAREILGRMGYGSNPGGAN